MQLDMHYYGVYCLARLAGLNQKTATTIAYASQFTDDSIQAEVEDSSVGAKVVSEATAHHFMDIHNLDPEDQRLVWVPFHFLPGNEGDNYYERLACGKDSDLAQEMLRCHLEHSQQPFAVPLMGIAAHVYADTFAHFGFSGVSSELNRIIDGSLEYDVHDPKIVEHIEKEKAKFRKTYGTERLPRKTLWRKSIDKIKESLLGIIGEKVSRGLGHAAVYTFPDRPYLTWRWKPEDGKERGNLQKRHNPENYIEACQKLHTFFLSFAAKRPDLVQPASAIDFDTISGEIKRIINFEGTKEDRIKKWEESFKGGPLNPRDGNGQEAISTYNASRWHDARDGFQQLKTPADIVQHDVYCFYQAASFHRHYVLRELLPANGIVVV